MNEHLRDRILRKLETLSDERGYHVLDYVEFLESRYAERPSPNASVFTRFTEAIEDKLRAGKVSASAIAETVGFMRKRRARSSPARSRMYASGSSRRRSSIWHDHRERLLWAERPPSYLFET